MINYGRSREQQQIFIRRRIAVAVGALIVLALIFLLFVHKSPSKSTAVGAKTTTTTPTATATTVLRRLVVATEPWQLPAAVSREVVLPLGGGMAMFGGLGPGNKTNTNILALDPSNGKTATLAALPKPVHDAAGTDLGTTMFVFGGGAATESATVQSFVYDGTTKSKPVVAGSLPTKRADLVTVSADGKVYLVGGFDGTHWVPSVLVTTDGTTFSTVAQLGTPVRYPAAAALNGKLYVFGGEVSPNQADATLIQQIDLQTQAVSVAGQIAGGLSHASAATLNGVVYVFGGRSAGHAVDTVSMFDPSTGQLQVVGHLGAPTSDMGLATVNGTTYLVGGENDAKKQVASVYAVRVG